MLQKLVSYFHAAVAPEFFQSVSEAVLIKHYTTKCSCLFLSREHWSVDYHCTTRLYTSLLRGSLNYIFGSHTQFQAPGLMAFCFSFLVVAHNVLGLVHFFHLNFSSRNFSAGSSPAPALTKGVKEHLGKIIIIIRTYQAL